MFSFFKKKRPDTTVEYTDKEGTLHKKHVSSEQVNKLLKIGRAKQVYKVLIKGPWEGTKEDHWELSKEVLEKFGDENEVVRILCVYEKGEPKYNYVAKEMWEKLDDIGKITSNPNLSPEQQAEQVNKLLSQ